MNFYFILVTLYFLLPIKVQGFVTTYQFNSLSKCEHLFTSDQLGLKKNEGFKTSWEKDPTQTEGIFFSINDPLIKQETNHALEVVYETYKEILKKMNHDPSFINEFIESLKKDDKKIKPENTLYLIWKWPHTGEVRGVIRAIVVKKGSKDKLLMENKIQLADTNRVELNRALNLSSPKSFIVNQEIMMSLSKILNNIFQGNDYYLYALTNKTRAILYKRNYGFKITENENIHDLEKFLVSQNGFELFERYIGHINHAYQIGFQRAGNFYENLDTAIKSLQKYEKLSGMKFYIPNLVAQTVLYSAMENYELALIISNELKKIGKSELNDDFNAIWRARLIYNFGSGEGDSEAALKIINERLMELPLSYFQNETSLIAPSPKRFTLLLFKLNILLNSNRIEEAKTLIPILNQIVLNIDKNIEKRLNSYFRKTSELIDELNFDSALSLLTYLTDANYESHPIAILNPQTYFLRYQAYIATKQNELTEKNLKIYLFLKQIVTQ